MNLLAKLTPIAGKIYRNTFKDKKMKTETDSSKDWSLNLCEMLGITDPEFVELMRMYLTIHRFYKIFIRGSI